MPDYYAILWRALKKGDFASAQWRDNVFAQTRHMLLAQLRDTQPPLSNTEIRLQTDALEAAIKTIQAEVAPSHSRPRAGNERTLRPRGELPARRPTGEDGARPKPPLALPPIVWVLLAIVVAAITAGAYAFIASRPGNPPPTARKVENRVEAAKERPAPPPQAVARPRAASAGAADGDLPPGVDGGSTEADVAFYFRRQPVFYRTTHPVGSIIVDKQQHFLYFIQPNQVALRYGVGVGRACAGVAGLRKVSGKAEWPEWQPPEDLVEHKLMPPGVMKGGPGNPLGARLIALDDGSSRIHGTNAPKTIGNSLTIGCIRLVNDDAVDLYNRVAIGARVIFTD